MRKQGYDKTRDRERIDNIPDTGTMTGNWLIDKDGCWWQYTLDKPDMSKSWEGRDFAWIIGKYPGDV